jgi:hypothetical protein
MEPEKTTKVRGHARWAGLSVLVAALLITALPGAAAGTGHQCPARRYWNNIVVRGMTCHQAIEVHREKLSDCVHAHRPVTPKASVYTCDFGPWQSTERVTRRRFSDRIQISRDSGRVWLHYDGLP